MRITSHMPSKLNSMQQAPHIASACLWRAISWAKRWLAGSRRPCTRPAVIPTGGRAVRFDRPTIGWACGVTGEVVRDTVQKILVGRPGRAGTGAIPKDAIVELVSARGIPELLDTIKVTHVSGGVSITGLKTYASGREKFQGETLDWVWFDEEPPADIYTEGLTRTNVGANPVWMTFTPLQSVSTVVKRFLHENDVEHYRDDEKKKIIASYPAHELEARTKGIPVLGSGRIFPVTEETIAIEHRDFPSHWPRIGGMDFGWQHPFGAVELVWDRDTDTVYVSRTHRLKEATPIVHAAPSRSGAICAGLGPETAAEKHWKALASRWHKTVQRSGLRDAACSRAIP